MSLIMFIWTNLQISRKKYEKMEENDSWGSSYRQK